MRRWGLAGLGAVALLAIGCTHDALDLYEGGDPSIPRPAFPWSTVGTPVPTATPILTFGDGSDGTLDVSGVINVNACARIESVTGNEVTTNPVLFASGDSVLLWQTQDEFATSGSQAVVTSASMALAGVWQLARVSEVGSVFIEVDADPLLPFDSAGERSAQACRVPEYSNVTVPALQRIEAVQWTAGTGGGVVAMFVSGTLSLAGTISASGRGYTGGNAHNGDNDATVTGLDVLSNEGGRKGEGLDGGSATRFGRGNWANAAGGGNRHSGGGGGGGGNGGAGGRGGMQWKPSGAEPLTQGLGGAVVATTYPLRLVMGGGGGEAQGHHGGAGNGGDGGGLVLIFAREITGAGSVNANGDAAGDSTDDAGSGGGAGGTIVIRAELSSFTGNVRARGGAGADAVYDGGVGDEEISGPGGGGGGGHVHLVVDTAAALAATDVSGGANGVNPQQADDPWGALAGGAGVVH